MAGDNDPIDNCPTCGSCVIVHSSDEGTGFYEPVLPEKRRSELELEVSRLKSDLRKAKRRAEGFKKKYDKTFNQWYQRCMEGWRRRDMVPPSIEQELERIRAEFQAVCDIKIGD